MRARVGVVIRVVIKVVQVVLRDTAPSGPEAPVLVVSASVLTPSCTWVRGEGRGREQDSGSRVLVLVAVVVAAVIAICSRRDSC